MVQTAAKRTKVAKTRTLSYVLKVLIANVNLNPIETNVNFSIHGKRKTKKRKKHQAGSKIKIRMIACPFIIKSQGATEQYKDKEKINKVS